jgi:hypothetical protein
MDLDLSRTDEDYINCKDEQFVREVLAGFDQEKRVVWTFLLDAVNMP